MASPVSSPQPDPPSMPSPSPNLDPDPTPIHEPSPSGRRQRLPRACTNKTKKPAPPPPSPPERRRREKVEEPGSSGRIITSLLPDPNPDDSSISTLRAMWQLASVLNFLHIFRPVLNIVVEFTAEELESTLISPNSILDHVHMPLLKSIPPVTRMAMGPGTWVTVLCRKLKDWWQWVAEGEIPIVADHGAEIEAYKTLDPATRLVILKAICDIRVEQEDIRNFIDHSLKRGIQLSLFRKERVGGDSHGVSYWYEDDPVIGHRLYREIRKVEPAKVEEKKKLKRKGRPPPPVPPVISYQWETLATNLDQFQQVSDKLFESTNRTEVSLAKKLKIDYLPEIEKLHKMNIAIMQKKERLMKKQQREALLLDSYLHADGLSSTGRALRHRKNVTYTFDDYDRSINEAIKLTKKRHESPEQPGLGTGTGTSTSTRRVMPRHDPSTNGNSNLNSNSNSNGPTVSPHHFDENESPKSEDYYDDIDAEQDEPLDRSNRRRKRPRRYADDFVGPAYEADSDDDIIGEAVYDDSYLETKKHKSSSASEGDEEYKLEEDEEEDENQEEDEYVEDEDEDEGSSDEEDLNRRRSSRISINNKNNNNRNSRYRKRSGRNRDERGGLRRSKRATRTRINYKKYEVSESDTDPDADEEDNEDELDLSSSSKNDDIEEENFEYSNGDDDNNGDKENVKEENGEEKEEEKEEENVEEKREKEERESPDSVPRRFLDLNELAPDGPDLSEKDEDLDDNS